MQLYYIEWADALTFYDEWRDRESICERYKNDDWIIRQAGYILKETKKYIIIASKYNPQEADKDRFAEITKIPKTWIRKKKKITVS